MARVWDQFLTEQDRRAVEKLPRRSRHPRGSCERPALVLVDFFRGVFGNEPADLLDAMDEWPNSCGRAAWDAIAPTKRLLAACRAHGMPIIHTTGMVDESVQGQHARAAAEGVIPAAIRYEIMPEVGPEDGETVIHKIGSSAFWGTPLLGQLIKNQIDTLIVCGESTSGCVRATVVDADQYQFRTVVVEDCTFDRHEATHAMNLFDMHRKYAEVLPLGETLDVLDEVFAARAAAVTA